MTWIPNPVPERVITLHGSILKRYQCENCGLNYGFYMHTTVKGSAFSFMFITNETGNRARKEAELKIRKKLKQPGAVPCPKCFSFQKEMFPDIRRRHRRWLRILGQILFCFIPVMVFWAYQFYDDPYAAVSLAPVLAVALPAVLAVAGLATGLIVFRRHLANRFDPNSSSLTLRTRLAERHAIQGQILNNALGDATDPEFTDIIIKDKYL